MLLKLIEKFFGYNIVITEVKQTHKLRTACEVLRDPPEVKFKSCSTLNVAKDFYRFPSGCTFADGPYCAEGLRALIVERLNKHDVLYLELDGTLGYASNFLFETFVGLIEKEKFTANELRNRIILISKDKPLLYEINSYIDDNYKESFYYKMYKS